MTCDTSFLVHDQLATVGLAVESDVVDANSPQLLWSHRATRAPASAEFGGSDGINVRRVGRCRGAPHEHDTSCGHYRQCRDTAPDERQTVTSPHRFFLACSQTS
jgi:hypothetical protein